MINAVAGAFLRELGVLVVVQPGAPELAVIVGSFNAFKWCASKTCGVVALAAGRTSDALMPPPSPFR